MPEAKAPKSGVDTGNSKLNQLKKQVENPATHPEHAIRSTEEEIRDTFEHVAVELMATESTEAPMGLVHAQLLRTEADRLSYWIAHTKAGRQVSRQPIVHPRSPYVRSEGEAELQGYTLDALGNAPDSMRMWNAFFRAFEADLPEQQTFEEFLSSENIRAAFQVVDTENSLPTEWTFHTKIPGVALHIGYDFPKEGEQKRGSPAHVMLAFEPWAIGINGSTSTPPKPAPSR